MASNSAEQLKRILQCKQSKFGEILSRIWFKTLKSKGDTPRLGLAVSGGVDSMALAYMCSKVHMIQGHRTSFIAFIVDHCLRPGSDIEAQRVAKNIESLSMKVEFVV